MGSFDTVDFFAQYTWARDHAPTTIFSLGATHLLDKNPPNDDGSLGVSAGYSGSMLGRVVTLGASFKF